MPRKPYLLQLCHSRAPGGGVLLSVASPLGSNVIHSWLHVRVCLPSLPVANPTPSWAVMIVSVEYYPVEANPELLKKRWRRSKILSRWKKALPCKLTQWERWFSTHPGTQVPGSHPPSLVRAFKFNYAQITFLFHSSGPEMSLNEKLPTLFCTT